MLTASINKALTILSFGVLVASVSACRNPLPCPDCDGDEPADGDGPALPDLPPLPDLPCGGADFMSDNDNCGSCGNECNVWYEGSAWEAGTCVDGVCGPEWPVACVNQSIQLDTCGEICSVTGETCVANGCSGLTAMWFDVFAFGSCELGPDGPDGTMTGPCDEQIPWMTNIETSRHVMCCCE